MNLKSKDVLLLGNKYLPNIQYRIVKNNVILNQPRLECRHSQILLIGLAYPKELKMQWESIYSPLDEADILHDPFCAVILPSLGKFKQVNEDTKLVSRYSDSVKRDFLRALSVENTAHPCDIFTLNKCEDNVRQGSHLSCNEMNANIFYNFIKMQKMTFGCSIF